MTAVEFLAERYNYITWMRNRDEISAGTADEWRAKFLKEAKEMEAKERESIRWRDPKEELPDCDTQVIIKGGVLKPEIGLDSENIHCTGYYCDGVWYVSPTDYTSIEIENPTGWRPIE